MHSNRDAKLMSGNFSRLRTSELRQLLNDDQKMSRIIRLSKKFQGLQLTKEDIFVSNCRLAEINLSHQPTLRKGKLKLANKHQEMEKLIISVQAKQDQLSALLEGHMLKMAHGLLLKKIEQNEEHGEVFFQKFVEGRMSVEKFLGRFQNSRCLHHIRLVQAVKTQDILEPTPKEHQISTETHNSERFPLVYPYNPPDTCRVHYSLVPFVILPNFYHPYSSIPFLPPFLPPLSGYVDSAQLLQPRALDFHQTSQHVRPRVHEQTPRWPASPARLDKLNLPTRHQQQKPR